MELPGELKCALAEPRTCRVAAACPAVPGLLVSQTEVLFVLAYQDVYEARALCSTGSRGPCRHELWTKEASPYSCMDTLDKPIG